MNTRGSSSGRRRSFSWSQSSAPRRCLKFYNISRPGQITFSFIKTLCILFGVDFIWKCGMLSPARSRRKAVKMRLWSVRLELTTAEKWDPLDCGMNGGAEASMGAAASFFLFFLIEKPIDIFPFSWPPAARATTATNKLLVGQVKGTVTMKISVVSTNCNKSELRNLYVRIRISGTLHKVDQSCQQSLKIQNVIVSVKCIRRVYKNKERLIWLFCA